MAAYIVVIDSEVTDQEDIEGLSDRLVEVIEAHGGKYLVRGGAIEARGGEMAPARIAISEFESSDKIRGMFDSAEFTELRELRRKSAASNVFIVEGV